MGGLLSSPLLSLFLLDPVLLDMVSYDLQGRVLMKEEQVGDVK